MTDVVVNDSATPASVAAGLNPISQAITEIGETARQVLPNPTAEVQDTFELQKSQIQVDQAEAGNANLFVSGWRPAIGWVGAVALAWSCVLAPLINWIASLFGEKLQTPSLPADTLYPVILALLGMGTLHTIDRYNGTATNLSGVSLTPQITPATEQPVKRKGWF